MAKRMLRRQHPGRRWGGAAAALSAAGGVAYVASSYFAATTLADLLISPIGLAPGVDDREGFHAAMRPEARVVEEFRHAGDSRDPVELRCTFASPGEPASRGTVVFLHGKGGNATEWKLDAVRALRMGFNVLCPDLRGHAGSGGRFVTYGFLEKGDLQEAIRAAADRYGIDARRLGIHGCSAGSSIALQLCAGNREIRALWLESPFSDARGMARHYLHRRTGVPRWALTLTSRWAVARAAARVRRELDLDPLKRWHVPDPLAAARSIRCPVALVFGSNDELVPPTFVPEIRNALPRTTAVWEVRGAGHCHHADEPEAVAREEYERRWREFFGKHLGDAV